MSVQEEIVKKIEEFRINIEGKVFLGTDLEGMQSPELSLTILNAIWVNNSGNDLKL